MRTMLKGALAAAVLLGGGAALADDPQKQQGQMGQMGTDGRAGRHGADRARSSRARRPRSIVRSDQGAAIPLKIEKSTKFDDPAVKSSRDLKPGQEVRASYSLEGTENVAKQVWTKEAKGGAGMEGTDKGINEPVYPEPNGTTTTRHGWQRDPGQPGAPADRAGAGAR